MSATTIIVNDVEPRRQYTATSGQTVFDFPIPFFNDADLQVYLTPAGQQSSDTADILVLTTNYSVVGANTQDSGEITLVTGATTGDVITIERVVSISRLTDFQTSGDLLAETVNREQDTEIFISQQLRADINRSFRLPITDTSAASLVLPSPTANYVIGWNSTGDAITNFQEIGQYQGTDATTTTMSYAVRDLLKSTTAGQLDNVYICIQTSPSGTLLTNTAYWSLIVDAVSAATSETNAAASASAAATSASNASTSETNAATSETNAASSESAASTSETNAASSASTASTAASNASTSETNAATSETNAGTSETNAASSAGSASSSASTATTKASEAATSASNASTSATNAGTSETNAASSASSAATSESNASTSETNAASSASSAAASYDDFDDRYLGAKATDPALDNDGDALITGALYFNTTDDVMKVWEGTSWVAAYASLSGALTATNNLSDVTNASTSRDNLGLTIGTNVEAYDATILKDADLGVTAQGYDADTTKNDVANTFTLAQTFDSGVVIGDWTVTEVTGNLIFSVSSVAKMKLDATGNLTVVGDVSAFGTL
tara:strand:+ start:25269 stop:26954 length:1686 start_codon:yes stop_codon:yes gene_type:complete